MKNRTNDAATRADWEENTFAGLEGLDDAGRERASLWGRLDGHPDEPEMVSSCLPVMGELDLDDCARLA
ncbi:MAG: hypothetical protein VYE22_23920 [Myxococcota bacterium]|nr:hypothetical protein [Myxococcota bacterium]